MELTEEDVIAAFYEGVNEEVHTCVYVYVWSSVPLVRICLSPCSLMREWLCPDAILYRGRRLSIIRIPPNDGSESVAICSFPHPCRV